MRRCDRGKERLNAEIERYSVDVREWYHGVKLEIFKHAFVSPFDMLEMLMVINTEKSQSIVSEWDRQENQRKYDTQHSI